MSSRAFLLLSLTVVLASCAPDKKKETESPCGDAVLDTYNDISRQFGSYDYATTSQERIRILGNTVRACDAFYSAVGGNSCSAVNTRTGATMSISRGSRSEACESIRAEWKKLIMFEPPANPPRTEPPPRDPNPPVLLPDDPAPNPSPAGETRLNSNAGSLTLTMKSADLTRQITAPSSSSRYKIVVRGMILAKDTAMAVIGQGGATGCSIEADSYVPSAGDAFVVNVASEQVDYSKDVYLTVLPFKTANGSIAKLVCYRRFSAITIENANTALQGLMKILKNH